MVDADELQRLFRYAFALTHDQAAAYDLLHDALEKALRKPPRDEAARLSYIRTIMRNQHLDQVRRRSRFPEENLSDHDEALGIHEGLLDEVMIHEEDLAAAWATLDALERDILYHWAVEELSAREIAVELDLPRGTVLSRLHRLRAKVQRETAGRRTEARAEVQR